MLTRLWLRNFQGHKKLIVRFTERITTIRGRSDIGKSAALRALRVVLRNKPAGAGFIRRGAKEAKIVITIDGKKIKRIRGKTKNEYHANGKVYKAFGATVPRPIESRTQIIDDNFQGQYDPPYWLSLNAGQLSKALNDVVDLETIDNTLAYLSQRQRQAKTAFTVATDRLRDAKKERERLRYVLRMDIALQRIAEWAERADAADDRRESLETALSSALRLRQTIRTIQTTSAKLDAIQGKGAALVAAFRKHTENATTLRGLIADHTATTEAHGTASRSLEQTEAELSRFRRCKTCNRPILS